MHLFNYIIMKNIKYILLLTASIIFMNCETNDKFTGSPVGNQEIITLDAALTTDVDFAISNQDVEFNLVLPRTFKDTATVEVTAVNTVGGRTRAYVDILPGKVSPEPEKISSIKSPGASVFVSQFELSVTAISLRHAEIGKHYLIKSDVISIGTGATGVQDKDVNKLSIKLVWPFMSSTTNDVKLMITKPGQTNSVEISSIQSAPGGDGKFHGLRIPYTPNLISSPSNSNQDGDYIFSITGKNLITSPIDMPYRFVLVYPNGDVEFFNGVYQGMFVNAPLIPVLKVTKANVDGSVVFSAEKL